MNIARNTEEQRAMVNVLRADLEHAATAENAARADKRRTYDEGPPEWMPIRLRTHEQNKVAGARLTLKEAEPKEGKAYEKHKAAIADAEQRERQAKADQKRLRGLIKRESARLAELEARDAAGIPPAAGAFVDFSEAVARLRAYDPAVGTGWSHTNPDNWTSRTATAAHDQNRERNFDRAYWTARAATAFDCLRELSDAGWPDLKPDSDSTDAAAE